MIKIILKWFDNDFASKQSNINDDTAIDWKRIIPFILLHLGCLFVLIVGQSTTAWLVMVISYLVRMFAITAFYHRYFAHKTFKTSRRLQTVFAVLGATATQRGPLWWAAHHRHHHIHSDTDKDAHSPTKGFWHSHMVWFLQRKNFETDLNKVPDLAQFPALRWIDRHDMLFPVLYALFLFILGTVIDLFFPSLGTNGAQFLVWGYFVSTVLLAHVTYSINSLSHLIGKRDYDTQDGSRNHWLLAMLTLGEGWHNNHHCCPGSVRQGLTFWQIDVSYYLLRLLNKMGLIWDLKYPNQLLLEKKKVKVHV